MLHAHAVENDSHMNYSFVVLLVALLQKQENDFISPNGNVVNWLLETQLLFVVLKCIFLNYFTIYRNCDM